MATLKPETVLERAQELYRMKQRGQALSILHEFMSARVLRVWSQGLEEIMLTHVKLCVQLRRGTTAKEGLQYFRTICTQTHSESFELVAKAFLDLCNTKASNERERLQFNLDAIEDLEDETVDAFAGEAGEKADREGATPWLRFWWESLRTVLDLSRSNQKFEKLYQFTAQQSLEFCKNFKRATEFRRLSESLRLHLSLSIKYMGSAQSVNLSNPESMEMALEVRFAQLAVATELGLWQEAYKTAEDAHTLLNMAKRAPKPKLMNQYYNYLTQIFWVSENHLFHAHAWYRLFSLTKNFKKDTSTAELAQIATTVVLSALSIPIEERLSEERTFELDVEKDRNIKLASLLGFQLQAKTTTSDLTGKTATLFSIPHLRDLISTIVNIARNMQSYVVNELKDVFRLVETEFQPLELAEKLAPAFEFIGANSSFSKFLKPIQKAAISRILLQLSQVYKVLKLENLSSIIKFAPAHEIEIHLLGMIKKGLISGRVDHQKGFVIFTKKFANVANVRRQLVNFAEGLSQAAELVDPSIVEARKKVKKELISVALKNANQEYKENLARKELIAKRLAVAAAAAAESSKAEEVSAPTLTPAVTEPSIQQQILESQLKQADDMVQEIFKLTKKKIDVKTEFPGITGAELVRALRKRKTELLLAEREEAEKKIKNIALKFEYIERGRRDLERPLIEEKFRAAIAEEKKTFESSQAQFIESHRKRWEKDLEDKARILAIADEKSSFEKTVMGARQEEYNKKMTEARQRYAEKLYEDHLQQVRLREEEEKRKEEERLREEERRKEEEKRKEEERIKEEERRAKEEEKRKQEEKLREEKRIEEEKRKEQVQAALAAAALTEKGSGEGAKAAPAKSWREREREKQLAAASGQPAPSQAANAPSRSENAPPSGSGAPFNRASSDSRFSDGPSASGRAPFRQSESFSGSQQGRDAPFSRQSSYGDVPRNRDGDAPRNRDGARPAYGSGESRPQGQGQQAEPRQQQGQQGQGQGQAWQSSRQSGAAGGRPYSSTRDAPSTDSWRR